MHDDRRLCSRQGCDLADSALLDLVDKHIDNKVARLDLVQFAGRDSLAGLPICFGLRFDFLTLVFDHHPRGTSLFNRIKEELVFRRELNG